MERWGAHSFFSAETALRCLLRSTDPARLPQDTLRRLSQRLPPGHDSSQLPSGQHDAVQRPAELGRIMTKDVRTEPCIILTTVCPAFSD